LFVNLSLFLVILIQVLFLDLFLNFLYLLSRLLLFLWRSLSRGSRRGRRSSWLFFDHVNNSDQLIFFLVRFLATLAAAADIICLLGSLFMNNFILQSR